MLHKTRAIVLHTVRYGETSIIVTLYAERYGRLSCMINGVRSKKSKFPATLFQPLSLLEADFYYRMNRNIQRMKEATCPFHYSSVPFVAAKNAIALFLAEVLYFALREEESNPPLFSFVFYSLQLFDTKETGTSYFHHWFMLQLTKYLGFFPPAYILNGTTVQSGDIHVFSNLTQETQSALSALLACTEGPPELHLSQPERNQLLESIIRYYAMHIDGFSGLKSYAILQEVFSPVNEHNKRVIT
jgi:DNA repair protein RecO (recombination protein O)